MINDFCVTTSVHTNCRHLMRNIFSRRILKNKLQWVQDYVVYHGAYPEGQVLIMQSKDVELIVALLSHYDINEDGDISEQALEALVQFKDARLLHDVLKKHMIEQAEMHYNYPHCLWQTCYELTLKMQDVQMLKAF